jgi:16S rRNA (cytidine1402-2'-O)-methyltransferase
MATLYLVSTPIGNLADITARAVEILGTVSRILCEDTRRTRILVDHLKVRAPLTSLHGHNEASRVGRILGWLEEGLDLALVSDAGTPLLSDPGARVVRAALDAGHAVVPIPGPSALLAAVVVSGLPCDRFAFLGFLPRKGTERTLLLERIRDSLETLVLFESPGRLPALLETLTQWCGPDRAVAVAREMTKLHENVFRGTLSEAVHYYLEAPPRGEVTVVIGPSDGGDHSDEIDLAAAEALGRALLAQGLRSGETAREISRRLGISRNMAYRLLQSLRREGSEAP